MLICGENLDMPAKDWDGLTKLLRLDRLLVIAVPPR